MLEVFSFIERNYLMEKFYCRLLVLGACIAIHALTFAAAAPAKVIRKMSLDSSIVEYIKGDVHCQCAQGKILCHKNTYNPGRLIARTQQLDPALFYILEQEYKEQEYETLITHKSASVPHFSGGYSKG